MYKKILIIVCIIISFSFNVEANFEDKVFLSLNYNTENVGNSLSFGNKLHLTTQKVTKDYNIPIFLGLKFEYIPYRSFAKHSQYNLGEKFSGFGLGFLISGYYKINDLILFLNDYNLNNYNLNVYSFLSAGYFYNSQSKYLISENSGSQFGTNLGFKIKQKNDFLNISSTIAYRSVDETISSWNFSLMLEKRL